MDYRKLIGVAGQVLVVSIPASFRKKHGLTKGDCLQVIEEENRLIFLVVKETDKKPIF
jgi:bifunctional DNA-binding transcriptional regulator/antitoxin component of YhaV-PrlF toxin-antitoxin module